MNICGSMRIVLPGEPLQQASTSQSTIKLGPGVVQSATQPSSNIEVTSTRSGIVGLQTSTPSNVHPTEMYWVESHTVVLAAFENALRPWSPLKCLLPMEKYSPALGEPVIGVITARHAEGYRVDIGTSQSASLDALAFEDATKRNKPNLKVGAVVYARVSLALPFCEPELECVDPKTGKSQGFGELLGGLLVRDLELGKCRALLSPTHSLLSSIGAKFTFETAIGVNGRVWVKATEVANTIRLANSIRDA